VLDGLQSLCCGQRGTKTVTEQLWAVPWLLPGVVQLRAGQMHPSADPPMPSLGSLWMKGERWLATVPAFTQPGFLGLFVQIKCESCRKNTYCARSWISPSSALFASLAEWSGFINFSTFQLR